MLRNIGATLAGLFVGSIVNMAFVLLNTKVLYPLPAGVDMNDPAAFNAYVSSLPALAFVVVLAAHLGQSFVGGLVGARLAGGHPMRVALIIGALTLLGGVANMMSVQLPPWMLIELPLYLVVAWAAGRMEVGRRKRAGSG